MVRGKALAAITTLALAALFGLGWAGPAAFAQDHGPDDPLADPVARGAWLYAGNCQRCHGPYADERVGRSLSTADLKAKIAGTTSARCQVRWARSQGGPLAAADIEAVVAFIATWEQAGQPPELPPLPPQPSPTPGKQLAAEQGTAQPAAAETAFVVPAPTPTPTTDPALLAILAADPVYQGPWVYTQNCLRCHFDYGVARMGAGLPAATVQDVVVNGKPGTSMPAFGLLRGGVLRSQEIAAVVTYIEAWEHMGAAPALPPLLAERIAAAPLPTGTPLAVLLKSTAIPTAIQTAVGPVTQVVAAVQVARGQGETGDDAAADELRTLWLYCICVTPLFVVLSVLLWGGILLIRRAREPEHA